MKKYDYRQAIKDDIKKYVIENNWIDEHYEPDIEYEELIDELYDEIWAEDSITGNGCYYYDTEEKCQEYVASNLSLYFEAANEFSDFPSGSTPWVYHNPAQHMDATIRCYLLGECIREACDEL